MAVSVDQRSTLTAVSAIQTCIIDVAAHAQVLVLSVPGAAHAAGAANGALHGGDRALPHPASMQGIFPTPASQFVRDLVARLLHAGTAPLDRCRLISAASHHHTFSTREGTSSVLLNVC